MVAGALAALAVYQRTLAVLTVVLLLFCEIIGQLTVTAILWHEQYGRYKDLNEADHLLLLPPGDPARRLSAPAGIACHNGAIFVVVDLVDLVVACRRHCFCCCCCHFLFDYRRRLIRLTLVNQHLRACVSV